MPGDWFPCATDLARKPKVLRLARAAGLHPHHAAGVLVAFWGYTSEMGISGFLEGMSLEDLPAVVGANIEFWAELARIKWVIEEEHGLRVPDNKDHPWIENGAKTRLLKRRRQERYRDNLNDPPNEPETGPDSDTISDATAPLNETEDETRARHLREENEKRQETNTFHENFHVVDEDVSKAEVLARELFSKLGATGRSDFLWKVALLANAGRGFSEGHVHTAVLSSKKAKGSRVAYFRQCLVEQVGSKEKLTALLDRVKLPPECPRGPPQSLTAGGRHHPGGFIKGTS